MELLFIRLDFVLRLISATESNVQFMYYAADINAICSIFNDCIYDAVKNALV